MGDLPLNIQELRLPRIGQRRV